MSEEAARSAAPRRTGPAGAMPSPRPEEALRPDQAAPQGRRGRPERVDLAVVGGGFAGLSAAAEAARRGLSVVLLERRGRPGEAVATTGLLPAEAALVLRAPPSVLGPARRRVLLGSRRHRWVELSDRGVGFVPTRTPELLAWLAEEAAGTGARLRFGCALRQVERAGDGFRLHVAGEILEADALVAADGCRSRVAARLLLPRPSSLLLGLEHHLDVPDVRRGELAEDAVALVVDPAWAPGYLAWAFAGADGPWQVGVLGPSGGRWRPAAALASFRAWLLRRCGFEPGRVTEVRAGLVPVGGAVRAPARAGRVRLAGDAAGHVSALTAGGIGRAAESGRLAVRDLAGEASAAAATRALAARCGGRRALLRAAWQLTRLPGGTEAAVLVARSAWGARAALSVLFSSTPPEEAGAPLAASEPS